MCVGGNLSQREELGRDMLIEGLVARFVYLTQSLCSESGDDLTMCDAGTCGELRHDGCFPKL